MTIVGNYCPTPGAFDLPSLHHLDKQKALKRGSVETPQTIHYGITNMVRGLGEKIFRSDFFENLLKSLVLL